jgi:hypothetical protein
MFETDVASLFDKTDQNVPSILMMSLNIVSVILHLVRSVLVHHVRIHINTGIQKQRFLFAVSNATRLSRRILQLNLPVDVVNSPPLLACTSYISPSIFLFMIQALGRSNNALSVW